MTRARGGISLTRRERHERIIEWFGRDSFTRRIFFQSQRLDVLTDEAIEELARKQLSDYAATQRRNAENRKISEARQAAFLKKKEMAQ